MAFAHEEAEKIADGAYLAREAGGDDAAVTRGGEVAAEGLAVRVERSGVFLILEVASEVEEVSAVVAEGVGREILLGDQAADVGIEEGLDADIGLVWSHGK